MRSSLRTKEVDKVIKGIKDTWRDKGTRGIKLSKDINAGKTISLANLIEDVTDFLTVPITTSFRIFPHSK